MLAVGLALTVTACVTGTTGTPGAADLIPPPAVPAAPETMAAPKSAPVGPVGPVAPAVPAERILVLKGARRLELIRDGKIVAAYPIGLGRHPVGPKEREGDGRTPEGDYVIDGRNPDSHYDLSLRISYPNAADIARARRLGVPPGGDIMIHGLPNDVSPSERHRVEVLGMPDWTAGCIAVSDAAIATLWREVPNGTPIDIRP